MDWLTLTWAGILAFVIMMYVVLDGFDLGIGILFPWIHDEQQRDIMMQTAIPVWDGNETWMVLGGALLYGAFPVVYSTLLPTLYMPLMIMLAALIFRGVAFEFRFKAKTYRYRWSIAFAVGSTIAAFCQGLILGTFVQGYGVSDSFLIVKDYQWLTPFTLFTGIAVIFGYGLLGAGWLIARTTHELQTKMYLFAKRLLILIGICLAIVSLWTPFIDPHIWHRWFSLPNLFYLLPLPIISILVMGYIWFTLSKRYHWQPFLFSIILFLLAYLGFCISLWPYLIPYQTTFWQAASARSSLIFLLIGIVFLLPVLLGYTLYTYRVFRGKIITGEGY
ncbi:MAG: cydB2 [Gammaproteobacteria bacterium]|jgi:cytochrome d ubiquinol oxidase subunit II|nr:cydB2 [Gammaproteobacteria bacterium]